MAQTQRDCDLILKGGVTSGAVYPFAITEIAKVYRLRQIGGSSVGAIATTIAASAEYRRQTGGGMDGFHALHDTADTLARDLEAMFQPYPDLKRPFEIMKQTLANRGSPLAALRREFRLQIRTAIGLGAGLALWALWHRRIGFALFLMLAALMVGAGRIAFVVFKDFNTHLREADFGLCPGLTQPGHGTPGFTNWITDQIDTVAGKTLSRELPPLTIKDLRKQDIQLATMTTDISSQRPYRLPLTDPIFYVRKSEMQRVLPDRVVNYICNPGRAITPRHKDDPLDLFQLPVGDDFPVILMARLSLSFPGLISAVPIWRREQDQDTDEPPTPMVRLLFSDGGIGSNFPIHFFDAALPRRITFGIKFAKYDEQLHKGVRVHLPAAPDAPAQLRTGPITGPLDFISAIFNTAKDWRDTLQSQLPGYAERIVEVRLEADQGGLNLSMPLETSKQLQDYGREAGRQLVAAFAPDEDTTFDRFDRHRYLRALSMLTALEKMLVEFHKGYTYRGAPPTPDYRTIMQDLETEIGPFLSAQDRQETLLPLMETLSTLGAGILRDEADPQKRTIRQAARLVQQANMRIVATAGPPMSQIGAPPTG